jgi:hypothetical protein
VDFRNLIVNRPPRFIETLGQFIDAGPRKIPQPDQLIITGLKLLHTVVQLAQIGIAIPQFTPGIT